MITRREYGETVVVKIPPAASGQKITVTVTKGRHPGKEAIVSVDGVPNEWCVRGENLTEPPETE